MNSTKLKMIWMLAAAGLNLAACAVPAVDDDLEPEDREVADGKADRWNTANNPTKIDSTFLIKVQQLPVKGGSERPPIPGDYWASSSDNLNVKWDGATSMSPAEKYGKAFGKPGTQEEISRANGVKASAIYRKSCSTDSDCSSLEDGSVCASSYDGAKKACIPTWWGICHGWSPYALSERTPLHAVTRTAGDGTTVTFYPGDIIGLMSLVYTRVPTKMLSSRCDKDEPATDSLGRVIDGECEDMNPGAWHVLVSNLMGLRHQGFVLDQTWDDEVWNQPGADYNVTNAVNGGLKEITKDEAIEMLGLDESMTSLLDTADVAKDAQKSGSWTASAAGKIKIKMHGTGDADLYVKKGSAPTTDANDCAPYTESSNEECEVSVASGDKVYWLVVGYQTKSTIGVGVALPGAGGTYKYNTDATRFFDVEMDFRFEVESSPSRTLTATSWTKATSTKHYTYILEADDYGNIQGGEWYGESLTDHPDFAWYPTGTPGDVAGVSYADLKALNDEAAGPAASSNKVTLLDSYTIGGVTSGTAKSKYVALKVESGYKQVKVTMTGNGDADMYIGAKGTYPTVTNYKCGPTPHKWNGTSEEVCTIDVSSSGGTYYVRERVREPNTTVTITAEKIK